MTQPGAFEVELAIEKLKSNKSPGIDQIPAELIKVGGRTIHSGIHKLIISICNKEELPEEWKSRSLYLSIRRAIKQTCCATNRKVAGSIPASVNGFFIDIKSFQSHYDPGVNSASNRNEYQEHFLGVKAAGA